MLKTRAIFARKAPEIKTREAIIKSIQPMNDKEFKEFSRNLLEDRDFIIEKKEEMGVDSKGKVHSILALNIDSGDGILIDSQGFDHARYSAFAPNIKSYIDKQISMLVDKMIEEATENTSNGSWVIYFDEIEENYGLVVKEDNGIGAMVVEELENREELAELEIGDECFDMMFYIEHCIMPKDKIDPLKDMRTEEDNKMDNIEKTIKVLKIEPQKMPYEKEIENDLEGIQGEVEGLFECIYLDDNCIMICNEEGKINGMELNRRVGKDIIAGPFFIAGDSEDGEFISLTKEQIERYTKEFGKIQEFTGEEPEAEPWMEFRGFDY